MYAKKEKIAIGCLLILVFLFFAGKKQTVLSEEESVNNRPVEVRIEGAVLKETTLYVQMNTTYAYLFHQLQYLWKKDSDLSGFDPEQIIVCDVTIAIPSKQPAMSSEKIVIHQATFDQLLQLYQIGEKRAEKIWNYLQVNRTIESWEKLKEITAISDAALEKIKEQAVL